jgi:tRNA threonylcarbamoyladenosine modification (KEOPS) complex  Pcc1 subunit
MDANKAYRIAAQTMREHGAEDRAYVLACSLDNADGDAATFVSTIRSYLNDGSCLDINIDAQDAAALRAAVAAIESATREDELIAKLEKDAK